MGSFREKKHRLPNEAYVGRVATVFTACIEGRFPAFSNPEITTANVELLALVARKHQCVVPVYCFMPDHLHVILLGTEDNASTLGAMIAFKQLSGFWFARHYPQFKWQKDFHDHVVRRNEDWANHVRYILANPVRKGLVVKASDWPHSGAIDHDLEETLWFL